MPEYLPSWLTLRAIGNSTAAKFSYLFPLIGYVLLFNDYVTGFVSGLFGTNSASATETIRQLYFIYFGLLAFSLASITYALGCGSIIKSYVDEVDFVLRSQPAFSSSDLQVFADGIIAAGSSDSLTRRAKAISAVLGAEGLFAVDGDLVLEIRKRHFAIESRSNPIGRALCFFLYTLGGVLLAIPTLAGIFQVARGLACGGEICPF